MTNHWWLDALAVIGALFLTAVAAGLTWVAIDWALDARPRWKTRREMRVRAREERSG